MFVMGPPLALLHAGSPEQQARYYARRLAELGFDVTLDPVTAA